MGGFVGLMAGYVLGMMIGFLLFAPDTDMWAALGGILALAGLILGLFGLFQRGIVVLEMSLVGCYLGSLLGILLFADIQKADLLELLQTPGLYIAFAGAVMGGMLGTRIHGRYWEEILFAGILGGFLLGYLFGVQFKLAPFPSMIGWSPFILGGGVLTGLVCRWLLRAKDNKVQ
jgi:hypothetical protein